MALSLNGKFSKSYARLATSYKNLGDYANALQAYDKAIQAAPTDKDLAQDEKVCRIVFFILYNSQS